MVDNFSSPKKDEAAAESAEVIAPAAPADAAACDEPGDAASDDADDPPLEAAAARDTESDEAVGNSDKKAASALPIVGKEGMLGVQGISQTSNPGETAEEENGEQLEQESDALGNTAPADDPLISAPEDAEANRTSMHIDADSEDWEPSNEPAFSIKVNKREAPALPTIFTTVQHERYGALITIPLCELSITMKSMKTILFSMFDILHDYCIPKNFVRYHTCIPQIYTRMGDGMEKYKEKFGIYIDFQHVKVFPQNNQGRRVLEMELWSREPTINQKIKRIYIKFLGEKIDKLRDLPYVMRTSPPKYPKDDFNELPEETQVYQIERQRKNPDIVRRERPMTIFHQDTIAQYRRLNQNANEFNHAKIITKTRRMWNEIFHVSSKMNINEIKIDLKPDEGPLESRPDDPPGPGDDQAGSRGDDQAGSRGDDQAGSRGDDQAGSRGDDHAGSRGDDHAGSRGDDHAGSGGEANKKPVIPEAVTRKNVETIEDTSDNMNLRQLIDLNVIDYDNKCQNDIKVQNSENSSAKDGMNKDESDIDGEIKDIRGKLNESVKDKSLQYRPNVFYMKPAPIGVTVGINDIVPEYKDIIVGYSSTRIDTNCMPPPKQWNISKCTKRSLLNGDADSPVAITTENVEKTVESQGLQAFSDLENNFKNKIKGSTSKQINKVYNGNIKTDEKCTINNNITNERGSKNKYLQKIKAKYLNDVIKRPLAEDIEDAHLDKYLNALRRHYFRGQRKEDYSDEENGGYESDFDENSDDDDGDIICDKQIKLKAPPSNEISNKATNDPEGTNENVAKDETKGNNKGAMKSKGRKLLIEDEEADNLLSDDEVDDPSDDEIPKEDDDDKDNCDCEDEDDSDDADYEDEGNDGEYDIEDEAEDEGGKRAESEEDPNVIDHRKQMKSLTER